MKEESGNIAKANTSQTNVIDVKMDSFKLHSICDFYNDFDMNKWTLKALASLIMTSNLEDFSGDNGHNTDGLRWGLQQLIEMCVDKQEQQIEELKEMAINSPEYILERAKGVRNLVCSGAFTDPGKVREVMDTVEAVGNVISLFGLEEYPEASIIKSQILKEIAKPADIKQFAANGTDG